MSELAIKHPISLQFLPEDVLLHLAKELDLHDATSLSFAMRRQAPLSSDTAWRDLDITASNSYRHHIPASNMGENQRCYDVHREAVRRLIGDCLSYGNRRRWRLVERLAASVRLGTIHGLLQLLDLVSENIKELELEGEKTCDQGEWRSRDHATIDMFILDAGPSFPSLTHLTLGAGSIHSVAVTPILCNNSPNLTYLDVYIPNDVAPSHVTAASGLLPSFSGDTGIKQLRIRHAPAVKYDMIFGFDVSYDETLDPGLISLIGHCPHLIQLSIDYSHPHILRIGENNRRLRDLHWNKPMEGLMQTAVNSLEKASSISFDSLRLVVGQVPSLESVVSKITFACRVFG